MLTIFSTCKPFVDEFKIIQTNAIKSWTQLGNNVEIILFGDEEGVSEISKELNLKHIVEIKRNNHGTPYLNDMFKKAQQIATYNTLCYVNADIIFLPQSITVVNFIQKQFKNFLIVGKRWHLKIDELIDFNNHYWDTLLRQYVIKNGKITQGTAIDYFVFDKELYNVMPPLLIGRTWWDTWLLARAILKTPYVFDATDAIFAIHQDHSYKHYKEGFTGVYKGEEAYHNKKIVKANLLQETLGTIEKSYFKITAHNDTYKIIPDFAQPIKVIGSYLRWKLQIT